MKLLRQLDIGEYDNSADPAENAQPESTLPGIIGQVNGTPESQITGGSGYFNGYTPEGLTPQQQVQYQQQKQLQQTTPAGALNPLDYYPTLNHNTNVGNYSGSEIGSTTLFAPAGRIVPLAMRDARDAAVHKQALQKLKEDEDFKSKYNVPYTKNTALNDELHQKYFEGQKQFYDNTVKKTGLTGAAAHRYLENDPHYQEWNASMQSAAKHEDYLVDKVARIHTDVKTGKFRSYPELDEAINGVMNEHAKLGQSDINPKGEYKFHQNLNKLEAESDFATVANEAVQHMVKQQDAAAGIDVNSPEYLKTSHSTDKYYSPEAIHQMAEQIHPLVAHNMGSIENTEKRLQAMYGAHEKTKGVTVSEKNGAGKTDNYDAIQPQVGATFNTTVNTGQFDAHNQPVTEVKPVYTEQAHNTLANDQQKKLSFVQSENMKDLSGSGLEKTSGNFEGNVQKVAVFPYNISEKRFYTPEEVANMKKKGIYENNHNVKFETGVVVNTSPKKDANGETVGGSATSVVVPTDDVKGKLSKGFDEKILENEVKAKELNSHHKPTVAEAEAAVTPNIKDYTPDIQAKIKKVLDANPGVSEEDVIHSLKKAGKLK